MRISESKTYIATLSADMSWLCEGDYDELFFDDSQRCTYLGLDYRLKGRDFLGEQYEKMKKKADKYVFAILNTTRDLLDRSILARSLWETCALPAIMYGIEACVVPKKIIAELEDRQRIVASFITGLPRTGGNTALALESGLIPMEARYHIGLHRFFNRLLDSSSELVQEALNEHRNATWGSAYKDRVKTVIDKYQLAGMTNKAAKTQIMQMSWDELLKDVYALKSLKFLSIRHDMWELPEHITDSEHSTLLCKFRTSNAGLGNRIPLSGVKMQLKICPLCQDATANFKLDEKHVVFFCNALRNLQGSLGLQAYLRATKPGTDPLWMYLGGDRCPSTELIKRGKHLQSLMDTYFELVFKTSTVRNLLSY